jgi:hypothetical protein
MIFIIITTFFLIKVLLVRYQNGIDVYNYVLRDSAYIKDKWCFHNIVFIQENELTFKGDFANDTMPIRKITDAKLKY